MRNRPEERNNKPNLWLGMLAGAAGGIVGSLAMNVVQRLASETLHAPTTPRVDGHPDRGPDFFHDSAPMKLGSRVYRGVTGKKLSRKQKRIVEPVVHYAFGALSGAIYGAVTEYIPEVGNFFGLPFGAAIYLGDEIAMPVFELSGDPFDYPLRRHLNALGTHCLYGYATEMVRREIRGGRSKHTRERDEAPEFGMA